MSYILKSEELGRSHKMSLSNLLPPSPHSLRTGDTGLHSCSTGLQS